MEVLWQDLRFGWRMLRRSPGFAIVAVLTLAIGIGANAAIFSVINSVILRPLPFPESQRIVWIWETDENRNVHRGVASQAEFLDWRDRNHSFQELAAWRELFFTLTGNGEPEQNWGAQVSGNFFRLFRVKPALGRDFAAGEEQPGHERVAMLSYALWQRRYGGDPSILGSSITLDDKPFTIVGVLPRDFSLFGTSRQFDVWVPFGFDRAKLDREEHEVLVFGRLRDGAALPQAQAEMETIQSQLKQEYPTIDQKNGIVVIGFHDDVVSGLRPMLLILFGAVGLVLLIACANVANLTLARGASREREIALRAALGANRDRVFRQLLTESIVLSLIGGALGVLLAYGGLHLLHAFLPVTGGRGEIPRADSIGINASVLAFTLGVSWLTGILFGLAPATQVSRHELYETLKEGGRGSAGGRHSRWMRSALVVSEVALSVMLLTGAGLLMRSFFLLMSEDLGFNPTNVLTMQVWLRDTHVPSGRQVVNYYQQAIERVSALPGVVSASAVNFPPLSGWNGLCDFDIQGRAAPSPDEQFTSQYRIVDSRYLRTMGITLKDGRDFAASDGPSTVGVAIVNEALAHKYWPNEEPVGKQIRLEFPATRGPWDPEPSSSWLTIVGVVRDVRDGTWGQPKPAQLYLLLDQNPSRIMHLLVKSQGDPTAIASAVRQSLESADPNQPVTEVRTMDSLIDASVGQRRLSMILLGIFAAVATFLAGLGIYGVMAYSVAQRTHEIGVRMALGAEPGDVLGLMVRDGMRLAGIGLALGIAGSIATTRYLQTELFGVRAIDPITLASVVLGLAVVAVAACYFPARRAAKVDPLVALRHE
ncbi:MAG TPA: ABC transporter permease [Candidatus Acidoferrales bacterium]|nr:ABC transporter permease [Candidatus Acidoferrales bacterium]